MFWCSELWYAPCIKKWNDVDSRIKTGLRLFYVSMFVKWLLFSAVLMTLLSEAL